MLFSGASQSASEDLAAKSIKYKYPDDWGGGLRGCTSVVLGVLACDAAPSRLPELRMYLDACVIIKQEQPFFFIFSGSFKGESRTKKLFLAFRRHNMSDLFHFNTNAHSHL